MPSLPAALDAARRDGWSVNTDGQTVTLRSNTRNLLFALAVGAVLVAWGGGTFYVLFGLIAEGVERNKSILWLIGSGLVASLFMLAATACLAHATATLLFGAVECRLDGETISFTRRVWFLKRTWRLPRTDIRGVRLHVRYSFRNNYTLIWQVLGAARVRHEGRDLDYEVGYDFGEHLRFDRSESLAHVIAAATGAPVTREEPPKRPTKKGRPTAAPDQLPS